MKQTIFSDLAYEHKKKVTRKRAFSRGDGCDITWPQGEAWEEVELP